jgi:hypothetical protein
MSRYFSKFPKLIYTKDNVSSVVTNLLTRLQTVKGVIDNSALYYSYSLKDGDTPEIVASKYYGDAELHWSILLFNNIIDPYYDWPMGYQQFVDFLNDKYGSAATSQITIHHYEKIIATTDDYSGQTTTDVLIIDLDTYNSLPAEPTTIVKSIGSTTVTETTSRNAVSCYDYENNLNESKRNIKLIKKEIIQDVKKQFIALMGR